MKGRRGRRSKLTAQLQKKICGYIEKGNTFERSCALCDIDQSTFHRWRQRGEKTKRGKFYEFCKVVKKAEEKFIAWNVAIILKAAEDKNWQAAAWILERKYFAEFGRKDRHEVTGKEGGPIHFKYEPRLDDRVDDKLNDKNDS